MWITFVGSSERRKEKGKKSTAVHRSYTQLWISVENLLADKSLTEVDDAAHDDDVREIDLYGKFQEMAVRARCCDSSNGNRNALR